MRKIYLLLLLFSTLTAFAQSYGAYQIDIEGAYSENNPQYEKWVRDGSSANIQFRQNPMGLRHLREMVERIINENNMKDVPATQDDTIVGSDVLDMENYEQLHSSIMRGNSEMKVFWVRGAKLLQIFAQQDTYQINIINAFD